MEEEPKQPYFLLPHSFPHTYDQIKMLLTQFLTLEDPKPYQYVNLMRDIVKINNLAPAELISFQPI
jgi:hypothetical protein